MQLNPGTKDAGYNEEYVAMNVFFTFLNNRYSFANYHNYSITGIFPQS